MADQRPQRRLAAILVADVVGYSRLMEMDEIGTLAALRERRGSVLQPLVAQHQGRIVKVMGDGVLIEFSSAVNAVACAADLQLGMAAANEGLPEDRRIVLRIGINLGDVLVEGGDLYGDGVNIAARLQDLAPGGETWISAEVYRQANGKGPYVFRDLGQRTLKNIAASVHVYDVQGVSTDPGRPVLARPSLALPDNPSIAILPFENLSGDPSQDYFADGMVEEIITALSRKRWLFVIARNSSFVYKNRTVDVKQIGRELGVRYVLQGSVRRAGDKLRITGQLIDAATGNHIWADRFDGDMTDVFDLQDRITESVVGALQPSILTAEIERSARKRPESLIAYDYVLRAMPLVWSLRKSQTERAQALLEQAIAIEPEYPLALSLAAWCHGQRVVYNWTEELDRERDIALGLAQRAAAINRDDPMVLAILGAAHTIVRDFEIATEHLERALSLDPNNAWAWNRIGWINVHRGKPDLAIQKFERAMRLSPFDPAGFVCCFGIADAYFYKGQYEETVEWSHKGLNQEPEAFFHLRVLVPALLFAGRPEEARQAFKQLMTYYPGLTISKLRKALPFEAGMVERIADGLRQVGLPN